MTLRDGQPCPLCGGTNANPYHTDKVRDYVQCPACSLVFVPASQHLSPADEKAYYDLHENHPDDLGYRRFLDRLFSPLKDRLNDDARGLDFGCGPGPVLATMFEDAGHPMVLYDPFYAPDTSVLDATYDFITLSEVAEHLGKPGRELDGLWGCVASGGWLGIMTKRVRSPEAFKTWHYITEPTHVSFFSDATFAWLAARWSQNGPIATLVTQGSDVVLFQKG